MWYAASLFMKGTHIIAPPVQHLWEESIVIIEALNVPAAMSEAREIGRSKEHK